MDEGLTLLLVGAVLCASALVALGAARTGVPVLVAFLALGMLLGSDGPGGIEFDDAELARVRRNRRPRADPVRGRPADIVATASQRGGCPRRSSAPSASSSRRC